MSDLAHLARLALTEQTEDIRLFVARLVRKYRSTNPELSDQMEVFLRTRSPRSGSALRKQSREEQESLPVDNDSRLSLLKIFRDSTDREAPLLTSSLEQTLLQLITERRQTEKLLTLGLQPTRSAIFVGPPGVGKTITARWIAAKLGLPLYVLDLTAVMSSLLGRSGSNLRTALDFAKSSPCVLLLDEIDAIAKRRSDDTDVGELKRLVTVILQEVDEWPSTGLLLAATNHPELIDPALWRRFDLLIEFTAPDQSAVRNATIRFLGPDVPIFEKWLDILVLVFSGETYSDIERDIQRARRALALGTSSISDMIKSLIATRASQLDHPQRIKLAMELTSLTRLSQHSISSITGVSRDTIRKHGSKKSSIESKPEKAKSARRRPDS